MENRVGSLINAIESGEYPFGKCFLRQEQVGEDHEEVYDVYCFAGVACEEYRKLHLETSEWLESNNPYYYFRSIRTSERFGCSPPVEVNEFFGIPEIVMKTMMEYNDSRECQGWDEVITKFKQEMGIEREANGE